MQQELVGEGSCTEAVMTGDVQVVLFSGPCVARVVAPLAHHRKGNGTYTSLACYRLVIRWLLCSGGLLGLAHR